MTAESRESEGIDAFLEHPGNRVRFGQQTRFARIEYLKWWIGSLTIRRWSEWMNAISFVAILKFYSWVNASPKVPDLVTERLCSLAPSLTGISMPSSLKTNALTSSFSESRPYGSQCSTYFDLLSLCAKKKRVVECTSELHWDFGWAPLETFR
jgi:hypothetical protein